MSLQNVSRAAALVVIFVLCIACTNIQAASADEAESTLRLGVMPSMDYLPLAVALREGYCKELGLKLILHKFYSANERDAALQGHAVDGAVIDFTGAVLQKAGGFDLRLTSRCDAPFYLMSAKDSAINTLQDLKGSSIAVSRYTVIDYVVDAALKSAGLKPEDVKKVEINKIPLRFEMLRNGRIDVTGLPDPAALIAESSGCRILATNEDLGFAVTGIIFTSKALQAQGDNIAKMYQAYDKGAAYLKNNPAEAVKDILIKDMGFSEDIVASAKLHYDTARLPEEDEVQNVVSWLAAKGLVPADFSAADLMDGRFVTNKVVE